MCGAKRVYAPVCFVEWVCTSVSGRVFPCTPPSSPLLSSPVLHSSLFSLVCTSSRSKVRIIGSVAAARHTVQSHLVGEREKETQRGEREREMGEEKDRKRE